MSLGPLAGIMGQMGGVMFGAQVGQALGKLADEVLTSTDVGLPLAPAGTGVLVPQNVAEFADGLDRPADEVRLFLALREAASPAAVRPRAVAAPAARRTPCTPTPAASRSTARRSSAASTRRCAAWRAASTRTTPRASSGCWAAACSSPRRPPSSRWRCAGWRPCSPWSRAGSTPSSRRRPSDRLPGHSALAETMRRRRATGGPAEQTFATLVGLELRPRRLRDAATVWGAMAQRTAPPSGTGSGRTPTCCPPRTTSTSRWTSWPGRAWTTSWPTDEPPSRTRRTAPAARARAEPARRGATGSSLVDGVAVAARPRRGRQLDALEEAARPLGPRVAGDERPEALVVARARAGAPARAPARSRRRTRASPAAGWTAGCCGRPACTSPSGGAGCPPSARWPARPGRRGAPPTAPAARAIRSSSPTEGAPPALLAGLQLGDHLGDPAALLGGAEGGRDEHDGAALLAVGGHRAAAAGAAPHLDDVLPGGPGRRSAGRRAGAARRSGGRVGGAAGHAGGVAGTGARSHAGRRARTRHPSGTGRTDGGHGRALPGDMVALRGRPQPAVPRPCR